MEKDNNGILILSPFFSPNVGGVESHLDDLVKRLEESGFSVFVQTYSPITTPGIPWKEKEDRGRIHIRRYRWFGRTLLHKIEKIPCLDFLYITPYLFIRTLFFMLRRHRNIAVIHAQGFNAAFIGGILKKIFKKRLIVSTHAIYDIPAQNPITSKIKGILEQADFVLTLGSASRRELISFGLSPDRCKSYRYWVDLSRFKPTTIPKKDLRKKMNWPDRFSVLFVGRLTKQKGITELIETAKRLQEILFVFAGEGPLKDFLVSCAKKIPNVLFLGRIDNKEAASYYNMADIFCIPSQYSEGCGRVAMEAVACGKPVVGSDKGGITEALDNSVSILAAPSVEHLSSAIRLLHENKEKYEELRNNCRLYAEKNFGIDNAAVILESYGKS